MGIRYLSVVSLPVADQNRSIAFFKKLGFDVLREAPMGPNRWVQMALPGAQTTITLVTWFEQMPPGSVQGLVLNTSDVKATHSDLTSKGISVTEIQTAAWGSHCTLKDPDGNGLVIVQDAGN